MYLPRNSIEHFVKDFHTDNSSIFNNSKIRCTFPILPGTFLKFKVNQQIEMDNASNFQKEKHIQNSNNQELNFCQNVTVRTLPALIFCECVNSPASTDPVYTKLKKK